MSSDRKKIWRKKEHSSLTQENLGNLEKLPPVSIDTRKLMQETFQQAFNKPPASSSLTSQTYETRTWQQHSEITYNNQTKISTLHAKDAKDTPKHLSSTTTPFEFIPSEKDDKHEGDEPYYPMPGSQHPSAVRLHLYEDEKKQISLSLITPVMNLLFVMHMEILFEWNPCKQIMLTMPAKFEKNNKPSLIN